MPKILHMTLKKKWFDLIASGQKKHEYRERKAYWKWRLLDKEGFAIKFDEVHFRNGYKHNAPFMRVEWKCLVTWDMSPCFDFHVGDNGEIIRNGDFDIFLGKVLEVKLA